MSYSNITHVCCLSSTAAITCPVLENPTDGTVSFNDVKFGSQATYLCNKGFVLSGNQFRTCLLGGVWSGQEPKCLRE